MHGSFEKYDEDKNNNLYRRWGIGFLLLPFLLVLALFVAAIVQPATSNWIGEAAQAEFSGIGGAPTSIPTQFARPSLEIRTVRAY